MSSVKLGDRVRVQYLALKCSGRSAEATRGRQVLEFIVGSREVIPGISRGVIGMSVGEQKRMTLGPKDAFGVVRRKLIKEVPRSRFPAKLMLHVGGWLLATDAGSGRKRRVRVVAIKSDTVVVDGSRPQAGEVIEVELQLVSLIALSGGSGESRPSELNGR